MVRKIVKYGNPVLETVCGPVTEFDTSDLHRLVDDMFETMHEASVVGLAAPQVAVPQRLTVIDCSCGEKPDEKLVLINPEIVATEGEQVGEQGCLSIPGFREDVKRAFSLREVKIWTLERGVEYSTPRAAYGGMVRERMTIAPTLGSGDAG